MSTIDNNSSSTRDIIATHAYMSGLRAGAMTACVTGPAVLLANHYLPTFRSRVGISGKWGLVVMSFMGAFGIVSDNKLIDGARNPERYLASIDSNYVEEKIDNKHHQLQFHQRVANFIYDHPYRGLIGMGVPTVGGIYLYQRSNKLIQPSQQIMHTRIYGQGAVVLLLLGSMAFHDYMHKHGRFEVEM